MPPLPDPSLSSASARSGRRQSLRSSSRQALRVDADTTSSSTRNNTSRRGSRASNNATSETLEIVVKVASGQVENLLFELPTNTCVADIKLAIMDKTDLPPERQRLIYFGRMLQDDLQMLTEPPLKMKTEGINYVHLCPKPAQAPARISPDRAGSTPRSAFHDLFSATLPSLSRNLERVEAEILLARRLGRRRRDRNREHANPYPSSRHPRTAATTAGNESPPTATSLLRTLLASMESGRIGETSIDEEEDVVPQNVPSSQPQPAAVPSATLTQPLPAAAMPYSVPPQPYAAAGTIPVMSLPVPIMLSSMMMPSMGLASPFSAATAPESPTFPRENQVLVASLASRFMEGITESGIQLQNLVHAGISHLDPNTYQESVERTIDTLESLSVNAESLAVRFREILDNPDGSPEARAAAMREASETVAETAQALQATLHQTLGSLAATSSGAGANLFSGYLGTPTVSSPTMQPAATLLAPYGIPAAAMAAQPPAAPMHGPIPPSMVGMPLPPGAAPASQTGSQHYNPFGPSTFTFPNGWF